MNNDLISRSELKKAIEGLVVGGAEGLKDYYENGSKSDENSWIGGVYDAWELIDNAPTVPLPDFKEGYKQAIIDGKTNFSRPQGEWIPVSERLPEEKINPHTNDFDEVLCTTDWGEVQAFKFGTPIIHHKPHFWLGGAIMDEHIIAWQYKPEPYNEGGA